MESFPKDVKSGIHSSPAWRSTNRDNAENKSASLLIVSLGKTPNGIPLPLRQTGGGAKQSIHRSGPSLTEELQTERER